jgi:hypothetical protein
VEPVTEMLEKLEGVESELVNITSLFHAITGLIHHMK